MGASYYQFCPVSKAMELLDERWTLLVLRELLVGTTTREVIQKAPCPVCVVPDENESTGDDRGDADDGCGDVGGWHPPDVQRDGRAVVSHRQQRRRGCRR